MSRRIDLLRLDYAFSVIVPCLLAIYFNELNLFAHLDIIVGFLLYAITGNTLNDAIDMRNPDEKETIERVKGFHWKEILAIAIIAFLFGTMLFIRTIRAYPINGLLLIITVVMVVGYCIKKDVPIINQMLLGASHVFFPYLMIKIDAGLQDSLFNSGEWVLMITFFVFGFAGQIVHEIIDGDSITKFSLKTQQMTVIISSIITIILGIVVMIIVDDIYFLPLVFIPFGSIFTFRRPTASTRGVKDVGIVMGNVILLYFLILIIQQMFQAGML
jgi:hypothetical protein